LVVVVVVVVCVCGGGGSHGSKTYYKQKIPTITIAAKIWRFPIHSIFLYIVTKILLTGP
jgi:hypothetical protein